MFKTMCKVGIVWVACYASAYFVTQGVSMYLCEKLHLK